MLHRMEADSCCEAKKDAEDDEKDMFLELWGNQLELQVSVAVGAAHCPLPVSIRQDYRGDLCPHGLHSTVWEGAFVLASYLHEMNEAQPSLLTGTRVLELGAGTGLVGVVAAHLGAHVLLTDLPVALPLLRTNAQTAAQNMSVAEGTLSVCSVDWTRPVWEQVVPDQITKLTPSAPDFDDVELVLAAEVIYNPVLFEPLLSTLTSLLRTSAHRCLLANRERGVEERFEALAREYQGGALSVQRIALVTAATRVHGQRLGPREQVFVYEIRRRES